MMEMMNQIDHRLDNLEGRNVGTRRKQYIKKPRIRNRF